ncbi:MAG: trypsin-like peptidase domain-containing protein [Solirubrobacterales bacterium]
MARNPFVAGVLGGLVVLVVGALGVAAGWIGGKKETVVEQSPIAAPAEQGGKGLTVHDIYKKDAPGVVFIKANVTRRTQSPFGFPSEQQGTATGSGFVVDDDGYVLTNAHVVDGADKIEVDFENDETADAKLVGKDVSSDVALLKVDADKKQLHPLKLGDSSDVQVGDPVVAIGNPFGLDRTVTDGIVSALQRQIKAPDNFTISNVIQTDAAINPGNSGGPLLNAQGEVIGINSQIATAGAGGGSIGIGFAIPVNKAKKISDQLRDDGKVEHAFLGITGAPIDSTIAKTVNLPVEKGVLIQQSTGPAKKAGLKGGDTQATLSGQDLALGGDVITKIDGKSVSSMDDVIEVVDSKKPGDTVTLTVLRSGKEKQVEVKLSDRPTSTGDVVQSPDSGGQNGPQIPGLP